MKRQDRLVGIDGGRLLRRAAAEMDAIGKVNARIAEVDGRAHAYAPRVRDVFYLEHQLSSGAWEAVGLEDIADQGRLSVQRALRDNLLPALTLQMIEKLVRGGTFNGFEPAKEYVLNECSFRCAGRVAV
jgi:hypothetical protein